MGPQLNTITMTNVFLQCYRHEGIVETQHEWTWTRVATLCRREARIQIPHLVGRVVTLGNQGMGAQKGTQHSTHECLQGCHFEANAHVTSRRLCCDDWKLSSSLHCTKTINQDIRRCRTCPGLTLDCTCGPWQRCPPRPCPYNNWHAPLTRVVTGADFGNFGHCKLFSSLWMCMDKEKLLCAHFVLQASLQSFSRFNAHLTFP